jgi:hypothetical protein
MAFTVHGVTREERKKTRMELVVNNIMGRSNPVDGKRRVLLGIRLQLPRDHGAIIATEF